MLRLISSQFYRLSNTNVRNRRELLEDIDRLIEKYNELPTAQSRIEEY